jgi:anti-sigma factor RsiW
VTPPTDPFREWDVAYVLGSLSPADRLSYEQHLAQCPSCEREVCQLAGMAGILAGVPKDWAVESLVPAPDVPATVLPRLARAARASRRRVLVITAAAIVAAAVIGAVLTAVFC